MSLMSRLGRVASATTCVLLAATSAVVGAVAVAGPAHADETAVAQLAERYAPIVVVRQQNEPCGTGEPYTPTAVDTVLGRTDVVLRGPDGQQITAPKSSDLAGKGPGWYLDYPGEPLSPGCDYEAWFKKAASGKEPTLYSRIATDPAHPDKLALQYWFFYVYNDWNDRHEGDWEMIQVLFDAPTAQAALSTGPASVAYAQHEGSQVTEWDSPTLVKEGDRPVVYPGQGSHAAYIGQSSWFGKSAAAGFGCDNTAASSVELRPSIAILPDGVPTSGEYSWLSFTGRWGQKAPSFNNGPTGPATKTQWDAPVSWQIEEGRPEAAALPSVAGPALGTFCTLTTAGSLLFIDLLAAPWLIALLVVGSIALIVVLISRTDWRRAQSQEPDRQRRAGQIVTASFGWFRHRARTAGIISVALAAVLAIDLGVQRILNRPLPGASVTDINGISGRWAPFVGAVVLGVAVGLIGAWLLTSLIVVVREQADGHPETSVTAALRETLRHRSGMWTSILLYLAVIGLASSLIFLPVALWLLSRWAVAPAAAVIEGLPIRAAFARSTALTKGHRWRTLFLSIFLRFIGFSLAGVIGALLLLLTNWPFLVSTLTSIALLAILLPVAFVGLALQFYDLRHRAADVHEEVPAAVS